MDQFEKTLIRSSIFTGENPVILVTSQKMSRKICLVTGSRADYGLLHNLARAVQDDPDLELQLVATGSHLSPAFGQTLQEIEGDGFVPAATVEMLVSSDRATGIARSIALGIIGMADAYDRLKPDVVVVLGDRYEILAAVEAALVCRIPVAHIHGGEASAGAMDESIRHAITKMSHIHFVAAEEYRCRVIQMGESEDRVWNTGALVIDSLRRLRLLSLRQLSCRYQFDFNRPYGLFTYHPASYGTTTPAKAVADTLEVLSKHTDMAIVISGVNADEGNSPVAQEIRRIVARDPLRHCFRSSFGHLGYLSLMSHAEVVVGNSSSGMIEAPALGIPTVNIGNRQAGRLRPASVIDAGENKREVVAAVRRALSPEFQKKAARREHPFGKGRAALLMLDALKTVELRGLLCKSFCDFPAGHIDAARRVKPGNRRRKRG
ncbi:MAG: UDP-N-acetylglucosamine 2-epimerase [Verrucomicrobiae bacterium]